MKGVTDWFHANTLISVENQKNGSFDNGKEVRAVNRKGLQVLEPQTNPLPISDGDDDFDRFFPLCRSSLLKVVNPNGCDASNQDAIRFHRVKPSINSF
ncbi:hypothetical protein AtNW77_Chr3g0193711 [Arabidopsis thaliana]